MKRARPQRPRRQPTRRAILQGAAASLAIAAVPACRDRSGEPKGQAGSAARTEGSAQAPRTLEADLRHLLVVVGPWTAGALAQADVLIPRYLNEERLQRFGKDRAVFARLAARLADQGPAAASIDLAGLPADERGALVGLTHDLYAVREVRLAASGTPDLGQCQADPLWHTKPPAG